MSKPIEPGDLVYVAHDCCGKWVGLYATVKEVLSLDKFGSLRCYHCGSFVARAGDHYAELGGSTMERAPIPWLRKVPPDAQPEDVQREEEIDA